jgi:phytoene dehydrogenase-like protein
MAMTGSFMHLHLGIPSEGLADDLECHHSVLNMDIDITAEQNMVIISIPTVFDKNLAPEGYHVVHAYTAACDSFDDWERFIEKDQKPTYDPNSSASSKYNREAGYQDLKAEKAEVLWRAVECVIPDVRKRAKQKGSVVMIGSPLTHRRYNQRYRGTYGPAPSKGEDVWKLGGATTKIKGLLACGDTTFPGTSLRGIRFCQDAVAVIVSLSYGTCILTGIGLPGVAASGTIAANTLVSVGTQMKLMKELKKEGALQ